MSTRPLELRELELLHAGLLPYRQAWELQRRLVAERAQGLRPDVLLLLEHPHTYTLGRMAHPEHLLVSHAQLARQAVDLVETDRGGDITYHGPGQLVGYPILKLSRHGGDLLRYLRLLEETIIRTLAHFGLAGERIAGLTGVWVAGAKIAAIGVKLSASGVTSHGFALNVSTDLRMFEQIVPCGIRERGVTSLQQLLGYAITPAEVAPVLIDAFCSVFDLQPQTRNGLPWLR